jgi:hypothetical protein
VLQVRLVKAAPFALYLHRRVRYLEIGGDAFLDGGEHFVVQAVIGKNCMNTHRVHS